MIPFNASAPAALPCYPDRRNSCLLILAPLILPCGNLTDWFAFCGRVIYHCPLHAGLTLSRCYSHHRHLLHLSAAPAYRWHAQHITPSYYLADSAVMLTALPRRRFLLVCCCPRHVLQRVMNVTAHAPVAHVAHLDGQFHLRLCCDACNTLAAVNTHTPLPPPGTLVQPVLPSAAGRHDCRHDAYVP